MKPIVIKKLLQSIRDLETAISKAKVKFQSASGNESLLARIENYESMLQKQKNLTTALCGYVVKGDVAEVNRHIKLINGLSLMIRDDARELLNSQITPTGINTNPDHFVS